MSCFKLPISYLIVISSNILSYSSCFVSAEFLTQTIDILVCCDLFQFIIVCSIFELHVFLCPCIYESNYEHCALSYQPRIAPECPLFIDLGLLAILEVFCLLYIWNSQNLEKEWDSKMLYDRDKTSGTASLLKYLVCQCPPLGWTQLFAIIRYIENFSPHILFFLLLFLIFYFYKSHFIYLFILFLPF